MTVAETIKRITRRHLEQDNGMLLGECITAVGWVNGTVPDAKKGIVELPMTDVAGAGIAVGAALVGRRPILVIRFQDFLMLNSSPLIFFAAKYKELHGRSAPIFVRASAAEGFGPVHSGVLHSIFMHFPGFRVCSPMTPLEYEDAWRDFMSHDDPFICSEHRLSYSNTGEMPDIFVDGARVTLYPVSAARFAAVRAASELQKQGIPCNVAHIVRLKPFTVDKRLTAPLDAGSAGLVIDPGYEIAGAARSIAYELTQKTGARVNALGLRDKTKCLCEPLRNPAPDAEAIVGAVHAMLG